MDRLSNSSGNTDTRFTSHTLEQVLLSHQILEPGKAHSSWYVGFSGGIDSTALLLALSKLADHHKIDITACHLDHDLQDGSAGWANHCQKVCRQLGLKFKTDRLSIKTDSNQGPEASARQARHDWFQRALPAGATLFIGHHQHDQAETVLLNLFRGAGNLGLSGIPFTRQRGDLTIVRPLLEVPKQRLSDYVNRHGLSWIEDPSNQDTRFRRNLVRQQILPMLEQTWPAIRSVLARNARQQAQTQTLLQELGREDLNRCQLILVANYLGGGASLALRELGKLSEARQINCLRFWIAEQGCQPLSDQRLTQIRQQLVLSETERWPDLVWSGIGFYRHRDRLYVEQAFSAGPEDRHGWLLDRPFQIEQRGLRLSMVTTNKLLPSVRLPERAEVGFRRGGERCRLPGRRHSHSLKKLFQELDIPSWQRDRVPLVYVRGEIGAIVGHQLCQPLCTPEGEPLCHIKAENIS